MRVNRKWNLLDWIILNIIHYAVGLVLVLVATFWQVMDVIVPIAFLLGLSIPLVYFTHFFGIGQTPGMKVEKIILCGTDGTYPIGYVKGCIRWVGMIVSGFVIGLGFLWILIDESRQGWHDKIADTYVVVE